MLNLTAYVRHSLVYWKCLVLKDIIWTKNISRTVEPWKTAAAMLIALKTRKAASPVCVTVKTST